MIDFAKFVKYSKPGPRYTSYPTAPEFTFEFTQDDLKNYYKKQSDSRALFSSTAKLPGTVKSSSCTQEVIATITIKIKMVNLFAFSIIFRFYEILESNMGV